MPSQYYNQSRIYKISCNLPSINQIYIGSTADFETRCISHRADCYNINSTNYSYKVYNYIRNNGGFGNFTIDVIEHYPCADKTALRIREQYWINEYKPTLNSIRAYMTKEEEKQYQKQYQKEYQKQITTCLKCGKNHTIANTTHHRRTKYCQNHQSTPSESTTESFIESDTDVE